jgi:hypothetical protein
LKIGQLANFNYCECELFPKAITVSTIQNKFLKYVLSLTMVPGQPKDATALIGESQNRISSMFADFESWANSWDKTSEEDKTKIIEEFEAKAQSIMNNMDTYLSTTRGSCTNDWLNEYSKK